MYISKRKVAGRQKWSLFVLPMDLFQPIKFHENRRRCQNCHFLSTSYGMPLGEGSNGEGQSWQCKVDFGHYRSVDLACALASAGHPICRTRKVRAVPFVFDSSHMNESLGFLHRIGLQFV